MEELTAGRARQVASKSRCNISSDLNRPPDAQFALDQIEKLDADETSQMVGICQVQAQISRDLSWQKETESRLKAIYERGEFRPQNFQAEWLPDSSGYTVQEHDPKTNKMIGASYDVRTGKRTASTPEEGKQSARGSRLSPDGQRTLELEDKNIFVRDLVSGLRTQLTRSSAERDVQYRDPVWSPDGNRVAFVEADSQALPFPDDTFQCVTFYQRDRIKVLK